CGADGPAAGAADEVYDGKNATADAFGRVFAGIGKAKRLLGPESEAGDESADDERHDVRSECTEEGEHTEQQQVELIDEPAAESIAELALPRSTDEHAEDRGGANQGDFRAAREF